MDRDYARLYAELEKDYWWFTARRLILRKLLAKEIDWHDDMDVLEIGVGPGRNLYSLYPSGIRLAGLEPDEPNAELARRRGPVPVYCGVIESMPPPLDGMTFDVITLFDVLEHIRDDLYALDILRKKLKPGGRLVLTVPAYMWMWGQQDVVNYHYRRHTRSDLSARLRSRGFRIRRATYFNTFLFPPVAVLRLLAKLRAERPGPAHSDLEQYKIGPLNKVLHHIFAAESPFLKYLNFPFGVSIFVVAEPQP